MGRDQRLRRVPAGGFTRVPAFARLRELGAYAVPTATGFEDDLIVLDQVFASDD
jgi:hypothetical protein